MSVPSHELFAQQTAQYHDTVLPKSVRRVAIEAAHPKSWYRWIGEHGAVLGIETFGASAPQEQLYQEYGLTAERLSETARALIAHR